MTTRDKTIFAFAIENSIDTEARTVRFVISSDEIDRDRDVVEQTAVEAAIPAFAKNPCCLACHMHRLDNGASPVIGKWLTETYKRTKHTSEMTLQFATTPLAEEYWTLYRDGFMKAVSIAFRVTEGLEQLRKNIRVYVITSLEMHEISCVPVGANRDALAKMKGAFGADLKMSDADAEILAAMTDMKSAIDRLERRVDDMIDLTLNIDPNDPDPFDSPLGESPDSPDASDVSGKSELDGEAVVKAVANATKAFQSSEDQT